jgi:hypothetical protein
MGTLDQYVSKGHHTVDGWFGGDQIAILLYGAQVQDRLGIKGGVAEVGVHHGRLFILLMLLRRPGERAIAIDVFDMQEFNTDGSGLGDLETLKKNIAAHVGSEDGLEIIKNDSMLVTPRDVVAWGRIRIFSVDGSHTTHNTASDLRLAHDCLVHGGLVVVDDYFNGGFPMVAEGVVRFMLLSPVVNIVPVLTGANKVVFTTKSHHRQYLEAYRSMPLSDGKWLSEREFFGHPCLCF